MSKKIRYIISELKDQYLIDDGNRPWIIGFSGGKDSTVLLQLTWYALKELREEQLKRKIYVICNDTLVENPIILTYVDKVLEKIEESAVNQGLPIIVKKTTPYLEDSFWVNIIGRGYPVPNNAFRWCTDKMKIKPTARFIIEQVAESGEAIVLIGTRSAESSQRARSIKKHEIRGSRLTKHPHHMNTFVYSPIKELMLEEVWYIINSLGSPWGADNRELFQIYADASADDYECPTMVTDKGHSSCGQSRFGCWTCTLVKEDKSMSGLITNGNEWLKPLLLLRNRMIEGRNVSDNRLAYRRSGKKAVDADGHKKGAYTGKYRSQLLEELLKAQKSIQEYNPNLSLINNQELVAIQVIWNRDLIFDYRVEDIYNKVYNKTLQMNINDEKLQKEIELLKSVCGIESKDFELIQRLLEIQKSKSLLIRKVGLKDEIENLINGYV